MTMRGRPGQAVDAIRDAVWHDINRDPKLIVQDLQAKGFSRKLGAVVSIRNFFLGHLNWLAKKKIYEAPILHKRIKTSVLRKQRRAAEVAVKMADALAEAAA
jgi:hypothetical protein